MPPKFDNFQYYFNHISLNGDCNADQHFIQEMYWRYYKPLGKSVLQWQLRKLSDSKRNALEKVLVLCFKYEKDCRQQFSDMCRKLSIQFDDNFINIIPFNGTTYKYFIQTFSFNKDPHLSKEENLFVGKKVLVEQIAVLITFEMYLHSDTADNEYLKIWLVTTENAVIKSKRITDASFIIARVKRYVYVWCCELGLKNVIPAKTYKKNGDFLLAWDYVVFADNKINFYHPLTYPYSPLVIVNAKSRKAMNGIKGFLSKHCPFLPVHATNGYIDDVYKDDLLEGINILHQRLHSTVTIRHNARFVNRFHKLMSQSEIKHKIYELKSVYLDFLCDSQLRNYAIIYCPENRVNSEGQQINEDAFIFTVKKLDDEIKLVFENTLDKHASIVFVCKEWQYNDVSRAISRYFSSDIINKRENIYQLRKGLKPYSARLQKVIHIDFYTWKTSVLIAY